MKSKRRLWTSDIAKAVGVHPNTVRLFEEQGFLPPVPRTPAGYRAYTEFHLDQMRLAWTALKFPYPGGKKLVVDLVQSAAAGDFGGALERAHLYVARVRSELAQAEAGAAFLERWAEGVTPDKTATPLQVREVTRLLDVSADMLRNWERNGLLKVPRDPHSGYRQYTQVEIGRLRVIRMLLRAGYSTMAILRMLQRFDQGQRRELRTALDTPPPDEDINYITDRWLSTLAAQEQRALDVIRQIETMSRKRYK